MNLNTYSLHPQFSFLPFIVGPGESLGIESLSLALICGFLLLLSFYSPPVEWLGCSLELLQSQYNN